MRFSDAVEVLYRLNTGVVGVGGFRHQRPHKPVMMLAVLDDIGAGESRPDSVSWSQSLRRRFRAYFEVVRIHDDDCTPENPFLYLRGDGLWEPFVRTMGGDIPLESVPRVSDAELGRIWARFTPEWQDLLADPVMRMGCRDALISRYFPHHRAALGRLFAEPTMSRGSELAVAESEPALDEEPGRSAAFRSQVLAAYDYQCAACGLRIWMPDRKLSFVDAAHLIPFAESRNDHPTNGLALCKNHHWAMDQRLIAPDTKRCWSVSRYLDPRRSRGEEELVRLAGQPLLQPAEAAFAPDGAALEWRVSRLLG